MMLGHCGDGGWVHWVWNAETFLLWTLLIAAVVLVVRHLVSLGGVSASPATSAPREEGLLADRYARGEIDDGELPATNDSAAAEQVIVPVVHCARRRIPWSRARLRRLTCPYRRLPPRRHQANPQERSPLTQPADWVAWLSHPVGVGTA